MSYVVNYQKVKDWQQYVCKIQVPVTKLIPLGGFPSSPTGGHRLYEVPTGELVEEEHFTALMQSIMMAPIAVQMHEITEDSLDEFYTRLNIIQRVNGCYFYEQINGVRVPHYITREEVAQFIGLSANVSYLPRYEWANRLLFDNKPEIELYRQGMQVVVSRIPKDSSEYDDWIEWQHDWMEAHRR